MARVLTTFASKMVLAVLLIHAVLLPLLFYALYFAAKDSHEQAFIDHTRIYARIFADLFQVEFDDTQAELIEHLDSAILGGRSIYAVLQLGDRTIISSVMEPEDIELFVEDFAFGEHGDNTYFMSMPLDSVIPAAVLWLGFDEEPTWAEISHDRNTLIYALLIYLLVSLLLVILVSKAVVTPLNRLRRVSRKIASGDYTRQLFVRSDITEIKELTDDLETMRSSLVGVNNQLHKEIAEREAAEADREELEARLRHTQRLESIGELAGGVAHEFNNVLLPLLLYTELSLEDLPDEHPIRPNLERILSLINRGKGLSQQILAFGRRSQVLTRDVMDIAPVVEEAMSMVRALIPASIDIRVNIEENAGTVLCDATEIQQLVVNLCSNACNAMSTIGGHITVSVTRCVVDQDLTNRHEDLREGEYVCLSVTDTGVGIDPDIADRIFEPFFTTQGVGSGTGLGLSVVHGIVVRHEGAIIVSSKPKQGATFDVYLPTLNMQASPGNEEAEK